MLCRGFPQFYVNGERLTKRQYLSAGESDHSIPPYVPEQDQPYRTLPKEYLASISSLRQKTETEFKAVAASQVVELKRALDTFSLKTELGRMEISWIKRADGIRDLDQAIED